MRYLSTRGRSGTSDFEEVLIGGLAVDGGLYAPETWPTFAPERLDRFALDPFGAVSSDVLAAFAANSALVAAIDGATKAAAASFDHPAVAPLVEIDRGLFVLELFHGPTLAFKDVAMQLVARLIAASLAGDRRRLLLITATSGDTGAAAVRAFAGAPGVDLVVLHPFERVSALQRRQMTTTDAQNVLNLAVEGDFDDCQRLAKRLLSEPSLRQGRLTSSVNSINWARLAAQIPYYLTAGAALGARTRPVRFVVPTGNFGDAFAGWCARALGLPGVRLLAAVNENDALARFAETGVYARTAAQATASVSMDVQAPSNLERLLFEVSDRDAPAIDAFFAAFERDGEARAPDAWRAALREAFDARRVTQAEAAAAQKLTLERSGFLACPHTGVGLAAALAEPFDYGPTVVLATAHAAKFPAAVRAATGRAPTTPTALGRLADLDERFERIAADPAAVLARVAGFVGA